MWHDAPRVLGDVFQAMAAAVFLDSSWKELKNIVGPIVEEHIISMVLTEASVDDNNNPKYWVDPIQAAERMNDGFDMKPRTGGNTSIGEISYVSLEASLRQVFCNNSIRPPTPTDSQQEHANS